MQSVAIGPCIWPGNGGATSPHAAAMQASGPSGEEGGGDDGTPARAILLKPNIGVCTNPLACLNVFLLTNPWPWTAPHCAPIQRDIRSLDCKTTDHQGGKSANNSSSCLTRTGTGSSRHPSSSTGSSIC